MKRVAIIISICLLGFVTACVKSNVISPRVNTNIKNSIPHGKVHFPFDNDEVLWTDRPLIEENVKWMKLNKEIVVILEGHCDELGESEYNMELGDKRARNIKAHMIQQGISHDRIIMVVSFGDTKPLDLAHSKTAWRKNRRVEFIIR